MLEEKHLFLRVRIVKITVNEVHHLSAHIYFSQSPLECFRRSTAYQLSIPSGYRSVWFEEVYFSSRVSPQLPSRELEAMCDIAVRLQTVYSSVTPHNLV